jgi:hypothetical protein
MLGREQALEGALGEGVVASVSCFFCCKFSSSCNPCFGIQ